MRLTLSNLVFAIFVLISCSVLEVCNGNVANLTCVNFEGDKFCNWAGYITITGSHFKNDNWGTVIQPDAEIEDQPFYELVDPKVSNETYIYAQFAYDRNKVTQGPHSLVIKNSGPLRANDHITLFLGDFYYDYIPVWSPYSTDTTCYIIGQSTDEIVSSGSITFDGWFGLYDEYGITFYPVEKGYTGKVPECAKLKMTFEMKIVCTFDNVEPTNYTFRYIMNASDLTFDYHYYLPFTHFLSPLRVKSEIEEKKLEYESL